MANSIQDLKINQVSQIYVGQDLACRCGCKGDYIATSFMLHPRSDVDDKLAQRRLNMAKKLATNGADVHYGSNHINIPYGNNRAITIYLDELKK